MAAQQEQANEGRIRPSFIAALSIQRTWRWRVGNEGRIRPSFIAASFCQSNARACPAQRGSNSTLLHCGTRETAGPAASRSRPTRVEFDPPSLRQGSAGCKSKGVLTTRVEFDPPSLRHVRHRLLRRDDGRNEGRIRPSFIAATRQGSRETQCWQRGSNSTLLHCGGVGLRGDHTSLHQRGSNSTLLHCGSTTIVRYRRPSLCNEGRIRPSFIAAIKSGPGPGRRRGNEGRIRPSFIAASPNPPSHAMRRPQRGSNSTLLHCGN